MTNSQFTRSHKTALSLHTSLVAGATRALRGHATLAGLFFLFGSAIALTAAQTGASRAAEIQDHFRKAAADIQANDANSAVKEFDAVLAIDPKNAAALTNRGAVRFLEGDCRSATPDFQSALAVEPSLLKAKAMLGICENRMGLASGKATLESVYPKLTEKNLRMQVGMELAGLYYAQGDLERTSSMIQSLLDVDPNNVDVLYLAQLVYNEMAEDTLNKLTIIAPGSARMQQIIAERLVNDGDANGAIVHYRKCLELDPHLPGVRYELAEAILEAAPSKPESEAEAQKELQTAIQTEGDNSNIEAELGRIALMQTDTEAAHEHYERALTMNPHSVEAQIGLARVLMLMGKPEDALKYLQAAVEADPLNSEAHYRLSTVYKRLNMPDDAAKETKLFEEIQQTKDQVGEIYRQMNKHPQGNNADAMPDTSAPSQ
jgi:tetratricopeptide (TPR) repeat protein